MRWPRLPGTSDGLPRVRLRMMVMMMMMLHKCKSDMIHRRDLDEKKDR